MDPLLLQKKNCTPGAIDRNIMMMMMMLLLFQKVSVLWLGCVAINLKNSPKWKAMRNYSPFLLYIMRTE